jgi:hypothetical protein
MCAERRLGAPSFRGVRVAESVQNIQIWPVGRGCLACHDRLIFANTFAYFVSEWFAVACVQGCGGLSRLLGRRGNSKQRAWATGLSDPLTRYLAHGGARIGVLVPLDPLSLDACDLEWTRARSPPPGASWRSCWRVLPLPSGKTYSHRGGSSRRGQRGCWALPWCLPSICASRPFSGCGRPAARLRKGPGLRPLLETLAARCK